MSNKKFGHFINGEQNITSQLVENLSPSDVTDVVGLYASGDGLQTGDAISAANDALPSWSQSSPQVRADILDKAGNEILARKEELGKLLSREEGKTLPEGIGEATRAGQVFKFFAGEALRQKGDLFASIRPGIDIEVTREPVGVIGIITPWNFPIAIPAWKIAPALAYGNTVVFKPAELVPGCSWEIVDILHRAGLPAGVLNLIMGKGRIVGQSIIDSPNVNAISFTGSVNTGKMIAECCAKSFKKIQLEMGGKNPLVILDDADLDNAVDCAINGAFFSTGQRCTASSRFVVTGGIHDAFVSACIKKLSALKTGHALEPDTHIGPVVNLSQLEQDIKYISLGQDEGAKLAFGGSRPDRKHDGFYLEPALFTETTNNMRINQEEIFGPVASVIRVADFDEALHVANDTVFGLSAGICTKSLKHSTAFKKHAQAGMIMVNLPTAGVDYHVPFGGTKGSSYGSREQGQYAREFYTTVKTAYQLPL